MVCPAAVVTEFGTVPGLRMELRQRGKACLALFETLRPKGRAELDIARAKVFENDNPVKRVFVVIGEIARGHGKIDVRKDVAIAEHFGIVHERHRAAMFLESTLENYQFGNSGIHCRIIQGQAQADLRAGAVVDIDHFHPGASDAREPEYAAPGSSSRRQSARSATEAGEPSCRSCQLSCAGFTWILRPCRTPDRRPSRASGRPSSAITSLTI